MARARNIKPGFFTNDNIVELPFEVRLLFIGLWTIADKKGRLCDRPKKIKMEIFPADDVDCDNAISMLAAHGFLRRYEVSGNRYIQIINWNKHQNPHIKEADSSIPEEEPEIPVQAPEIHERAVLIPDSLNLIPDSLNLIPDSLNLIPDSPISDSLIPDSQIPNETTMSGKPDDCPLFDEFWTIYPRKEDKKKAKTAFCRLSVEKKRKAVDDCAIRYVGTEKQYIPLPTTYIHGERWDDEIKAAPSHKKAPKPDNFDGKDYGEGGLL